MKIRYGLLIIGLFLFFCVSCQNNKELHEESSVPESTELEISIGSKTDEAEFPDGIFVPETEESVLPEISHLNKNYFRKMEELSEVEKKHFEKWKVLGELLLQCENTGESIDVFMYVVQNEDYYIPFKGTAYKQENNNLYVGDIYSTTNSEKLIGKYILSYQIDEVIMSVGYFNNKEIEEEEGLPKEGVYRFYYQIIPFEQEAIEKVGKAINCTDYSDYSGRWFPVYPVGVKERQEEEYTYMDLKIHSDGSINGCMSWYEGILSENSYTEFSGWIENDECIVEYEDDGYGHGGTFKFTFCENGIIVYVDENGEPSSEGFPTGNNYYLRYE